MNFRIGLVPASLKNSRRPVIVKSKGGKPRVIFLPSKEALADQKAIRDLLVGCQPVDGDVILYLHWFVAEDAIEFTVVPTRTTSIHVAEQQRPKGARKGRQDLQGIVEAVCDAIQGYLVKNDRQIATIYATKVYERQTT